MGKTITYTDAVIDYLVDAGVREHPVLKKCREETARMGGVAIMQIAPEQGAFMALTAQLMNAKRYIEVGTFTGYSALSVALALPADGHVDALDISDEYMAKARGYWAEAGQAKKITGHVRPAVETLDLFLKEGQGGGFDFAFIDADKTAYLGYYERLIRLVRPGGLIAVDNTLWGGAVANPADREPDTVALREFNDRLLADARIDLSLVPIGDGVTLARRR